METAGYDLYSGGISLPDGRELYRMANLFPTFEHLHTQLAESLVACRAKPKRRAVHILRTTSRRIEALLRKSLKDHPQSRPLRKSAKEALGQLKKVRKAAGPVRDLDVQKKLMKKIAASDHVASATRREDLEQEREKLDGVLRRCRKQSAGELRKTLKEAEPKVERALEDIPEVLQPLRETSPLKSAKGLLLRTSLDLTHVSGDRLHDYRKQTKPARYLAEMQETSATAQRLAKKLKKMLDDIGRWHDLLLLAQEAKSALGKRSALAEAIEVERDHAWEIAIRSAQTIKRANEK